MNGAAMRARRSARRAASAGSRAGSRAGVTLVEISIVILLIGVLFMLLFGVIVGLTRITRISAPVSQDRARAFLALENLRSSFAMTYFNRDVKRLVFRARTKGPQDQREDSITFSCVHPNSESVGQADVRDVSYYVVRDPEPEDPAAPFVLYRRENDVVREKPGQTGAHYPLLRNVASFRLRYTLNGREWVSEWNSRESRRIPRLIEIQLRVKVGARIDYFETVAAPGLYIR